MRMSRNLGLIYPASSIDEYTYLLLHCDGNNGSTTFIDSSNYSNTITNNLSYVTQTTSDKKFGSAGANFTSSSSWLTPGSVTIGSQAFTFDAWINATTIPPTASSSIFSVGGSNAASTAGFSIALRTTGYISLLNSSGVVLADTITFPSGWNHVALVGNGGVVGSRNYALYVNGVGKGNWSVNYNIPTLTCYIGTNASATSQSWVGGMDEVRLSIGVQRWTTSFTPPAYPYS